MLKRKLFEPERSYRAVAYLRMSSDKQNPRSPDQQEAEIRQRLKSLQRDWRIIHVYRDDAKSGRYQRNRPGYQQMLRDIRSRAVEIDLILVDTLERFGRNDDLPIVRKELLEQHGVLLLTADTGFSDPTTPQGKAFGAFEAMRATEENRIKAYQVLRGKRDLARRGFWPGGPRPFGYQLVSRMADRDGRHVVEGSVLEPHPEEAWIIQRLFEQASVTGHGQTRLARSLNQSPEIPATIKPFYGSTVGYWLDQPIYYGELAWEQHSTDIIDDVRVIERNAEADVLRIPGFCEPLISRELWDTVQAVRQSRRKRTRPRRKTVSSEKQLTPLAPGVTLSYLLSGLVCCGHCRAAMRPVTSGRKSKVGKKYVYYACPRAIDGGNCINQKNIPEEWLRQIVVEQIVRRLFPGWPDDLRQHDSAENNLSTLLTDSSAPVTLNDSEESIPRWINKSPLPDWFCELQSDVSEETERLQQSHHDPAAKLDVEKERLQDQLSGWTRSLSKHDLADAVRNMIEEEMGDALTRIGEIDAILARQTSDRGRHTAAVCPGVIAHSLSRLPAVLSQAYVALGNIELAVHIDRIDCFSDGRVSLRTCRLGALASEFNFSVSGAKPAGPREATQCDETKTLVQPRRRSRRQIDRVDDAAEDFKSLATWAADPDRFADLEDEWFEESVFQTPQRKSWAAAHAADVAKLRAAGLTMEKLAGHFGKTVPTIRKALRHAAQLEETVRPLPQKMPRPRWHERYAEAVADMQAGGTPVVEIASHFGKSDTTIRKALKHALR